MFSRIVMLLLFCQSVAAEVTVQALLEAADAYRLADAASKVETEVLTLEDGALDRTRRYQVLLREERRSLVLMQSPAERGQKVLMLGDDYWLVLPGSRRPIRITPMQKLLGDASVGDIATMTWAGDYDGQIVGRVPCDGEASAECLELSLEAQRSGSSYARIVLWLDAEDHRPVKADLYVASGKLAKRADFRFDSADGVERVSELRLFDELQSGRETRIRYLSREPYRAPDAWFNPMFLARTGLDP